MTGRAILRAVSRYNRRQYPVLAQPRQTSESVTVPGVGARAVNRASRQHPTRMLAAHEPLVILAVSARQGTRAVSHNGCGLWAYSAAALGPGSDLYRARRVCAIARLRSRHRWTFPFAGCCHGTHRIVATAPRRRQRLQARLQRLRVMSETSASPRPPTDPLLPLLRPDSTVSVTRIFYFFA